jgi:hypothetical protein
MYSPTMKPVILSGNENQSPALSLRSIVQKSALLNLVIVLTSFPVLVFEGGPLAVAPALAIMAGITILIWSATFTLYSVASLARIFWTAIFSGKPYDRSSRAREGVADHWLDGPG